MLEIGRKELAASVDHLDPTQLTDLYREMRRMFHRADCALDAFTMPDYMDEGSEEANRYTYGSEPAFVAFTALKRDLEAFMEAVVHAGTANMGEKEFFDKVGPR